MSLRFIISFFFPDVFLFDSHQNSNFCLYVNPGWTHRCISCPGGSSESFLFTFFSLLKEYLSPDNLLNLLPFPSKILNFHQETPYPPLSLCHSLLSCWGSEPNLGEWACPGDLNRLNLFHVDHIHSKRIQILSRTNHFNFQSQMIANIFHTPVWERCFFLRKLTLFHRGKIILCRESHGAGHFVGIILIFLRGYPRIE